MSVATLIDENKQKISKWALTAGLVMLTPIAAWLLCMAIGGCKALVGCACNYFL